LIVIFKWASSPWSGGVGFRWFHVTVSFTGIFPVLFLVCVSWLNVSRVNVLSSTRFLRAIRGRCGFMARAVGA